VYLIAGIVLNSFVFPPATIDYSTYFQPGDVLHSRTEGFDQTVLSVNDGWLHTSLEMAPNAPGPPEHLHESLDETFTVKKGTMSILINGEKRTLKAGETITVPRLTPHRPFNETNETVVVESDDPKTLTNKFAYHLSQLYPFVDRFENGPGTLDIMMQFSVFGNEMDAWIADRPPIFVQKSMRVLMAPTARMLGYKNYYEEYRPKHQN
jgi:mannose-6-phosphate isomerase-like protein (cupin superfamily)